mmetsp:Transcript_26716/g.63718  ORF Transcript_26716/g.63718 Transcript_26716/m.63718 type:complete len:160 (+) Transcript_26716:377-856(+)
MATTFEELFTAGGVTVPTDALLDEFRAGLAPADVLQFVADADVPLAYLASDAGGDPWIFLAPFRPRRGVGQQASPVMAFAGDLTPAGILPTLVTVPTTLYNRVTPVRVPVVNDMAQAYIDAGDNLIGAVAVGDGEAVSPRCAMVIPTEHAGVPPASASA